MLHFFLGLFLWITELLSDQAVIRMHASIEENRYPAMERFSLLESLVLSATIKNFHAYRFDPLTFKFTEGEVKVSFLDESAYLFFAFEEPLYARLDYDLVFDSALAYGFIDESEYLLIDKNPD